MQQLDISFEIGSLLLSVMLFVALELFRGTFCAAEGGDTKMELLHICEEDNGRYGGRSYFC